MEGLLLSQDRDRGRSRSARRLMQRRGWEFMVTVWGRKGDREVSQLIWNMFVCSTVSHFSCKEAPVTLGPQNPFILGQLCSCSIAAQSKEHIISPSLTVLLSFIMPACITAVGKCFSLCKGTQIITAQCPPVWPQTSFYKPLQMPSKHPRRTITPLLPQLQYVRCKLLRGTAMAYRNVIVVTNYIH